jgi:hypothetical protein
MKAAGERTKLQPYCLARWLNARAAANAERLPLVSKAECVRATDFDEVALLHAYATLRRVTKPTSSSPDLPVKYGNYLLNAAQLTYSTEPHSEFHDERDDIRDEADRRKIRRVYFVHGALHYIPMTHRGDLHETHTLRLR